MKNSIRSICVCLICLFGTNNLAYSLDGFTHPFFDSDKTPIILYDSLYTPISVLSSNTEAGWLVSVLAIEAQYLKIRFLDDSNIDSAFFFNNVKNKVVYIHKHDVGVVIQNESSDSVSIPVYNLPDNTYILTHLMESKIATIENQKNDMVQLRIPISSCEYVIGWVDSVYLCGNPYTTCN